MYMSFLIYRTEGEIEMDQTMRKLEKSPPTNELLTNDNYPRLLITGESKAAYGYTEGFFNPVEGKVFTREDFKTYVTIVSGGKARRWFNADSVFLYTLPVDDPFKKGYTHCTGMIVSKKRQGQHRTEALVHQRRKEKRATISPFAPQEDTVPQRRLEIRPGSIRTCSQEPRRRPKIDDLSALRNKTAAGLPPPADFNIDGSAYMSAYKRFRLRLLRFTTQKRENS